MRKTLEQILEKNQHKQVYVAIEELSELIKELTKHLRGQTNIDNITEEIADCRIIIEEMMLYFGIEQSAVEEVMITKIKRLKERELGVPKK